MLMLYYGKVFIAACVEGGLKSVYDEPHICTNKQELRAEIMRKFACLRWRNDIPTAEIWDENGKLVFKAVCRNFRPKVVVNNYKEINH